MYDVNNPPTTIVTPNNNLINILKINEKVVFIIVFSMICYCHI